MRGSCSQNPSRVPSPAHAVSFKTRAAAAARAALIIAAAIVTPARSDPTFFTPPSVVAAAREGTLLPQRVQRAIEAGALLAGGAAWRHQAPGTYATATVGMEDVLALAGRATWSEP